MNNKIVSFEDRRPKTLGEQMEAIDMDAAARGCAYLATGLTGTEKVDYSFSRDTDVKEFHRQQELSRKASDKLRNDPAYVAEVEALDAILQGMQ